MSTVQPIYELIPGDCMDHIVHMEVAFPISDRLDGQYTIIRMHAYANWANIPGMGPTRWPMHGSRFQNNEERAVHIINTVSSITQVV